MTIEEAKQIYEKMLEEGQLFMFMPNLTGEWQHDKAEFFKEANELENILNIDFDED